MILVVPAINEVNFEELLKKVELARSFKAPFIKFDVSDGDFSSIKTWSDPTLLSRLPTDLSYEVHFMYRDTDTFYTEWLRQPIKRFIFHIETTGSVLEVKRQCEENDITPVLSTTFKSDLALMEPYIKEFDAFQVLTVVPGESGQNFDLRSLEMISYLRKKKPNATIEVDGGVNDVTALQFIEAGADILASTSYIFESPNPKASYEKLLSIKK